jgi:cell division protease FtsH
LRQNYRTAVVWVFLIALAIAGLSVLQQQRSQEPKQLTWTQFMQRVDAGDVKDLTIKELDYFGELRDNSKFHTTGPYDATAAIAEKLRAKEIALKFEKPEQASFWLSFLLNSLPIIALFLLFFVFMRQMQAGGGKAMSFGKSRAKLMTENTNKVTFADVAGMDESKEELEEIVSFLKDPKKFTRLGGRIPKGVLMMGPPGTGKTLLARAVAGEAGVPFFSISGSDFVEMFVGVGASRVRDLFEQGKKNAPCIIFIDEIDAVGRHRGAGLGGGHDEREQTLNQLLVEMDGFESNEGVILIAATNRPDVLDTALLRPGRFDRRITVPLPDIKGRVGILKVHIKKVAIDPGVDLLTIARGTPGFSGADLENVVNEAALYAARRGREKIIESDIEYAKEKRHWGPERRSMVISEKEKRNTAVHEAGHALVSRMLPGNDPIHKITIIPRGPSLGSTWILPQEDVLGLDEAAALNQIAFAMGGRVAEEITFNHKTTGAGNDIERATEYARRMVCEWGMSEKLGPLSYGKKEGEVFLGREMTTVKGFSDETSRLIDSEIRRIVEEQHERARKVLTENRDILNRLADALVEFETLDGEDLEVIVRGGTIDRPPPTKPMATSVVERPRDVPPAADAPAVAPVRPTPGPARDGG